VTTGARYAIYFVPAADTHLYRFGAAALGYDCITGVDLATFDALPLGEPEWHELTGEPRRYGFHATLKAPFRLAAEYREAELIGEFEKFARSHESFPTIEPAVRLLKRFVAIIPATRNAALDRLAASCVTVFDRFRAPLTEADRARRTAGHLNARQTGNVERWGYPYVFGEFRFHMTLTGALPTERQALMLSYLADRFAQSHDGRPVPVDRLALLRQDRPEARFAVMCHAPIGEGR
jgi:putative phosphonate metabolism protein